jgi:hypothetical protein
MIENEDQLRQTRAAINDLESAVAALKREVLPLNPERFAIMAEPLVDHIRALRLQVEDYVGMTAAVQVWQRQGNVPEHVMQ